MKTRTITVLFLLLNFAVSKGQVVTCNPVFPLTSESVVITFNADQGNMGLKDYTGDIYAHTGVITDQSTSGSDWKYVVAGWSENLEKAKLTRVSANVYTLTITPSIRDYYAVPAGESILRMAFVFRSADGTKEAKSATNGDIFYDVSETFTYRMRIMLPESYNTLVNQGDNLVVSASASAADSIILYDNEDRLLKINDLNAEYNISVSGTGLHKVSAHSWYNLEEISDSAFYFIKPSVVVADAPSGLRSGVNITSDNSVTFLLYAPGKDNIFVTGDFNDWLFCDEGFMKRSADGNWFWLEVPGLDPETEYGFQYVIDGSVRIPDPYTGKVLDPDNDKYISETTYPQLKNYPTDMASGLVSVFRTRPPQYVWKNSSFTPPSNEDLVIYELLVRDFTAAHDFNTIRDTLDYLSTLGVNAIEFMPVFEFEGNSSWGYNPSMYFAVDKYYGPSDTFKELIDSCHSRGIAVIMDMVLNHAYGSNPLVRMYYDNTTYKVTPDNPWFNVDSPNSDYSWGYDFNHASLQTQAFVDSVNHYWISEFRIDGFRYDFTKGFTNTVGNGWAYDASRIAILNRMADKIRTYKPDALLILEHFADNYEEKELAGDGFMLWGDGKYQYQSASKGYSSDFSESSYLDLGWTVPGILDYMESHDEERIMYENLTDGNVNGSYNIKTFATALKRVKLSATLFLTIPGPKMLWQFQELGYDYSIDYNGRVGEKPVRWDYYDVAERKNVYDFFSSLIELKKKYAVFKTSDYSLYQLRNIKCLTLKSAETDAVVLGNFDVVSDFLTVSFPRSGKWYEFFTGDSITIPADNLNRAFTLAAGNYRIYTSQKLERPPFITSVDDVLAQQGDQFTIYPNPFAYETTISVNSDEAMERVAEIFSAGGVMVKSIVLPAGTFETTWDGLNRNGKKLPPGIYIVRINSGGKYSSSRVILR